MAASTQRQALNALVFLYRDVLLKPLGNSIAPVRSKRKRRPPTVLTEKEVKSVFDYMSGTHLLMARLIYGSGIRLMKCIRLRIQDVDFGQGQIYVRDGKGGKDRTTYLPKMVADELSQHIEHVKILHQQDLAEGFGAVYLPDALAKKYKNAAKETGWQYVFPGRSRSIDPRSKIERFTMFLSQDCKKR